MSLPINGTSASRASLPWELSIGISSVIDDIPVWRLWVAGVLALLGMSCLLSSQGGLKAAMPACDAGCALSELASEGIRSCMYSWLAGGTGVSSGSCKPHHLICQIIVTASLAYSGNEGLGIRLGHCWYIQHLCMFDAHRRSQLDLKEAGSPASPSRQKLASSSVMHVPKVQLVTSEPVQGGLMAPGKPVAAMVLESRQACRLTIIC